MSSQKIGKYRQNVGGVEVPSQKKLYDSSTPSRLKSNQNTPKEGRSRTSSEQTNVNSALANISAARHKVLQDDLQRELGAISQSNSTISSPNSAPHRSLNSPKVQSVDQSPEQHIEPPASQSVSQSNKQSTNQSATFPVKESPVTVRSSKDKKNAYLKRLISSDDSAPATLSVSIFPVTPGHVAHEVDRIQSPLPVSEPDDVSVESEKVPVMVNEYEQNLAEQALKNSPQKSKSAQKRERKAAAKVALTSTEPTARQLDANAAKPVVEPAVEQKPIKSPVKPVRNNQSKSVDQQVTQPTIQPFQTPVNQFVQATVVGQPEVPITVTVGSPMLPTAVLAFRVVLWCLLSFITFDMATQSTGLITSLMLAVATTRLITVAIYLIASVVTDSKAACYESGGTRLLSIFSATCLSVIPFLLSERALPLSLAFGSVFLLRRFVIAFGISSLGLLSFASDNLRGLDTVLACCAVTYLTVVHYMSMMNVSWLPCMASFVAFLPCFISLRPSMALALFSCILLHYQTHFTDVPRVA